MQTQVPGIPEATMLAAAALVKILLDGGRMAIVLPSAAWYLLSLTLGILAMALLTLQAGLRGDQDATQIWAGIVMSGLLVGSGAITATQGQKLAQKTQKVGRKRRSSARPKGGRREPPSIDAEDDA